MSRSQAEAQRDLDGTLDELAEKAGKLTIRRKDAGTDLKRRMEAELKTLGMRAPIFEPRLATLSREEAAFKHREAALGPEGADTLEFYIAPNLGQTPMPLVRIASGGEVSRVILALKRLGAQRRGVATMIFDEVDAGIGGAVATVVGRKLKQLAQFHQILCVTHLPQIAAFADRHFVVQKEERRGATRRSHDADNGPHRRNRPDAGRRRLQRKIPARRKELWTARKSNQLRIGGAGVPACAQLRDFSRAFFVAHL